MQIEELHELIASGDNHKIFSELMSSRNADMPSRDVAANLDPLKHDVMNHGKRKDKMVKLSEADQQTGNYVNVTDSGSVQPGFKVVPVDRIPVALQQIIVNRAVSFALGNPVKYVPDMDDEASQRVAFAVEKVLSDIKSKSFDRKMAKRLFSETECAEYWYLTEAENSKYGFDSKFKVRVALWSPVKGDNLYPYFDEIGDMIAFSRDYCVRDSRGNSYRYFETYTAEWLYKWEETAAGPQLMEGYPMKNEIGKIPVVYGRQEHTEWEVVQPLIDRLEVLLSNFADTNDYHASPKIFVTGSIEGWAQKGESGAVIQGDEGATMQYVSWAQAPEATKLEIETLLNLIYSLSQTPDISFENVKGLGATSGVALKMLFMDAHLKVRDKAEIFDEYFQRRANIIMAYLAALNHADADFGRACRDMTMEPELQPYMIEDETTLIANLAAATGNKAIASRKTAIKMLNWAVDADEEAKSIEEEEGAAVSGDLFGQNPYDTNE